ncbi:MAG TPA: 2-hydroxyhepta-2,4-diene-1,7-dioate isomerase, partial [Flavisolibacter sp.]|nr:2-hydroxyhepta-2,4-diene-1,7-dioate isomerase [Flavisolibacter sp.]
MKIYKSKEGILLEKDEKFYSLKNENWDEFINDDHLFQKIENIAASRSPDEQNPINGVLAPIGSQELWACGVTYLRSKIGRQEESKDAGGGDFYARV